jgi:hypothetical protein
MVIAEGRAMELLNLRVVESGSRCRTLGRGRHRQAAVRRACTAGDRAGMRIAGTAGPQPLPLPLPGASDVHPHARSQPVSDLYDIELADVQILVIAQLDAIKITIPRATTFGSLD